jgi:hypothetical protein
MTPAQQKERAVEFLLLVENSDLAKIEETVADNFEWRPMTRMPGVTTFKGKEAIKGFCPPQKLPACPETLQIATNLKSRDQKHMTTVHAEILPALAERLGRFVALLDSQFTI